LIALSTLALRSGLLDRKELYYLQLLVVKEIDLVAVVMHFTSRIAFSDFFGRGAMASAISCGVLKLHESAEKVTLNLNFSSFNSAKSS
jgi:hypothetical protein